MYKHLQNFQLFNESHDNFDSIMIKNLVSDNKEISNLWHIINEVISELNKLKQTDLIKKLKHEVLKSNNNDNRVAAKIASECKDQSQRLEKLIQKLKNWKGAPITKSEERLIYKTTSSDFAIELKDALSAKPWKCRCKVSGLVVEINPGSHDISELRKFIEKLPIKTRAIK